MGYYEDMIALSRYARYRDDLGRRELWPETVDRYISYFKNKFDSESLLPGVTVPWDLLRDFIVEKKVMPSMRSLMTAGPALDRDNVAGYNCSYIAVDNVRAFDEILYVLCCGTGVGFSVERQYIAQLPTIEEEFHETDTTIIVKDSKIGWASSFRELLSLLYSGKIPRWDLSKIRPAGARLKTFGGRASGPEPLGNLFEFTVNLFKKAKGRKLNSLEVHDLVCKVAEIVVVGGVRRSALISLSNLSDDRMRVAKSGKWWETEPQRALANNSVCYTEKPDIGIFMKEWQALYESGSGERGIFSRVASKKLAARSGRREVEHEWGTNPCSEIVLRSAQFCNLSEVVVRPEDDLNTLKDKVVVATILGTFQSTLTNFRYLRSIWKKNTEEERLLGVSLTGIMDHGVMSDPNKCGWILDELRKVAIETNKYWSTVLGIPQSTAITCVKPSGTVSQLVNSSSGIHPRYSKYYIRGVRMDKKDPLYSFMKDKGFPNEDIVGQESTTAIFYFPHKSPGDLVRDNVTALGQLELWKVYQERWCEHKPSITVYVRPDEWLDVGAWCYKNFDILSGVSFLPFNDHVYKQAPYTECTKEYYEDFLSRMPGNIDWGELSQYESTDNTVGSQELACTAGSCEIV